MKQGELIGITAIAAIVLMFVMGAVGPDSWLMKKWNSMPNGYSQSQQGQAPANGSSVVGGPNLSAQKIDAILSSAGSPAVGTGSTFYADSIQYNIDDAAALAWYHHESSYGLYGVARETHGIGNIRCTDGYSCIDGFRSYTSWQSGIDDWYQLIKNVYVNQGLTTIPQIIYKYAPASDGNSPDSYISSVESDINTWRSAA